MSARAHNTLVALSLLVACMWGFMIWHWSSLPASSSPLRGDIAPSYYDQLAHFCVFGLLAVFVWIVLKMVTGYPSAGTFSICFTYGIIDEIHQGIAGQGRIFSNQDLMFDGLGILVAIVILGVTVAVWKRYVVKV